MFPLKVKMVIMSHLSDVQDLMMLGHGRVDIKDQNQRINFVKYLVLKFSDTNMEIDADKEFELFLEKHPQFKI